MAGAGDLAQAEAGVHPPGGHGGWQVEKEVAGWRGEGFCPSLHSPPNNGALLSWWAGASSMNTPGCGRTTLQLFQAVSVPPTPVLPTGLSCKPPVPASAHPSKRVSQAGTPRAVA